LKQRVPEEKGRPGGSEREAKVGERWSEEAEKRASGDAPRVDWSVSPAIQRVINIRSSGTEDHNWFGWIRHEFLDEPLELGLSIGCGTGLLEQDILDQGLCIRVEGVDIAEGALAVARRLNEGLPVTYRRHDLDSDTLPRRRYDIIFSSGALHHVCDLEFCVSELHAALVEDGLFALGEFNGPARFQWTAAQLELISTIYSFLPWRYRYNYQAEGTVPYPRRPEVCSMVKGDPSEAVRSDEMLEVVDRYFERLGRREIGGTLLNPLLAGILENFDEEDELDLAFLMLTARLEELLIEGQAIPSDFVIDVYRRRPEPLPQPGGAQGRGVLIKSQERLIEELMDKAVSVWGEHEEAVRRIEDTRRQAGEVGAEVARLQAENARLKTGPLFAALKLARRLAGRPDLPESHTSPTPEAGPQVPSEPPARCSQSEACAPATGEAAAITCHVDGIASGAESLLLRWLQAVGLNGERALAVGLEPAIVELARLMGVFQEADIGETDPSLQQVVVLKDPAPGQPPLNYDLVFLDLAGCSADPPTALQAAKAAVADGGALVIISAGEKPHPEHDRRLRKLLECLPADWWDGGRDGRGLEGTVAGENPTGIQLSALKEYTCEARRGFGVAAEEVVREALSGRTPSSMERAVGCLLIYAEALLMDRDMLKPAFTVEVYRKGPGRTEHAGRQASRDIVRVQQLEIERLGRMLESELERGKQLDGELNTEIENLERAVADLERLAAEAEILRKRGPVRYRDLARLRAENKRRSR
jgi:SAM-dependent methyltransferase